MSAAARHRANPRPAERPLRAAWVAVLAVCGTLALATVPARAADPGGLDALSATREHPLFTPTRRPPPRPAVLPQGPSTPAATEAPPPSVEVRGVIYGGDRRVAIVKRPQDLQTMAVKVGGQIDGWVVAEIHPRGIVLERGGRSITLPMPEPGR